ncbi:hypothetical protein JXA02_00130 [candidate division KSB1 bacterium]|nr:hypothetical protein [candidate division KSB1 bacterium]RQW11800.1 MAG: hypothetical protein EH222_00125 [candidate division KSB1 bacterium]
MRHHAALEWEARLDEAMRELDTFLEEQYDGKYVLHPARPAKGQAANPVQDGLFGVTASFTLGLGSTIGKGYVVDIKVVTLQPVDEEVREEIETLAQKKLTTLLPKYFPDVELDIARDGRVLKIFGDLSLGKV